MRSGARLQVEPGDRVEMPDGCRRVARVCRDPGADRRRAEVDLGEQPLRLGEPRVVLGEGGREAVELLPERHGHRILQLGAADLQDVAELLALARERVAEQGEFVQEVPQREGQPDLDGGGVRVVRALAAVDVVDRVDVGVVALGVAVELQRDVGDDLVGVHVRRGARAALHDADDELVVEAPVDDELAGPVDELGLARLQHADLQVRARGGLLHAGERDDEVRVDRDGPLRDGEVLEGPRGVDAPVGLGRNLTAAEGVGLGAGRSSVRARGGDVGHVLGRVDDVGVIATIGMGDVFDSPMVAVGFTVGTVASRCALACVRAGRSWPPAVPSLPPHPHRPMDVLYRGEQPLRQRVDQPSLRSRPRAKRSLASVYGG